jgi:phage tail sheath protein FI
MPPTIYEHTPGVWINEVRLSPPPIAGVSTSIAAFVGQAPITTRYPNIARAVTSYDQFLVDYVLDLTTPANNAKRSTSLSRAVKGFFQNGGQRCWIVNIGTELANDVKNNIGLFDPIDEIAIIAAPGITGKTVYTALADHTEPLGDRFAIYDPAGNESADRSKLQTPVSTPGGKRPVDSQYGAFYYPRVEVPKELDNDPDTEFVAPSGHIAGIYARVDTTRGVHKAPANEAIRGISAVEDRLTDADQDSLNNNGVNILRVAPDGRILVWGARTLTMSTNGDKSFLHVSTRRFVNYVEESLQEGLSWAVFEPNNLQLQKQISRAASAFLDRAWADGALFGATAAESYYVRFPDVFNQDADRALGKLTVEIGLRVTYPAEFIIIRIGLLMQSAITA